MTMIAAQVAIRSLEFLLGFLEVTRQGTGLIGGGKIEREAAHQTSNHSQLLARLARQFVDQARIGRHDAIRSGRRSHLLDGVADTWDERLDEVERVRPNSTESLESGLRNGRGRERQTPNETGVHHGEHPQEIDRRIYSIATLMPMSSGKIRFAKNRPPARTMYAAAERNDDKCILRVLSAEEQASTIVIWARSLMNLTRIPPICET